MIYPVRASRRAILATLAGMVLSVYLVFTLLSGQMLEPAPWYQSWGPCSTPKEVLNEMVHVTFETSAVLKKLHIAHALCYGALWGALRYGKLLPWDNNVDFCVLKSEIEKVPFSTLSANLQEKNLELTYKSRLGEYVVSRGSAQVVITVFDKTMSGQAVRNGFMHRFLWFFNPEQDTFPASLIEGPFLELNFHGQPMPVPNKDMEILKYMYKDDWWLEKPPLGCPPVMVPNGQAKKESTTAS